MKIKKLFWVFAGAGILMTSCSKEENILEEEVADVQQEIVPADLLKKLEQLSFNTEDVKVGKSLRPDGTYEKMYFVEEDIAFTAAQIKAMSSASIETKQYRTYNLVSSPRTIRVIGFTGGAGQALTQKQRTALENAIANYNALNIGLSFTLDFGTNYLEYDIVVFQNPNGAAGGQAGFPVDGNPFQFVQIFSGMEQFSVEVNQHVMIHEIGHTLGLRHTDWYSRESCGRPSFGELANPTGAVHIPGTPRRLDPTSVMLSCFSTAEDGQFGEYDIVALEYLY